MQMITLFVVSATDYITVRTVQICRVLAPTTRWAVPIYDLVFWDLQNSKSVTVTQKHTMSESKELTVNCLEGSFFLEVDSDGDGGGCGNVTSTYKETCPKCDSSECYFDCDMSKSREPGTESPEECFERFMFNARIDALESFVLAYAIANPLAVSTKAFRESIDTTINSCGQNAELTEGLVAEING